MKIIALLGFLVVSSQVEGRSVDSSTSNDLTLSPLQQQCLDELKLGHLKGDIVNFNYRAMCPEDNPEFNNFISCFWKKTGRQNENGEINYDTVRSFVREGIIQAIGVDAAAESFAEQNSLNIVENCKTLKDADTAKLVAKFRNCIVKGLEGIGEQ